MGGEFFRRLLKNGHIVTYSNYESNWYSFEQVDEWVNLFWNKPTYHFETKYLDKLRAEPGQISIFDAGDSLSNLLER